MSHFGVRVAAAALMVALAAVAAWSGGPEAVDGGVAFTYSAPQARTIHLAGEFNGWDPAALPMTDEDGDGVWEVVIDLQTERTYQYKFVVNGGERWEFDPENPERADDGYGSYNSVVSIAEDGSVAMGAIEREGPREPIVGSLQSYGEPLNVAIIWHQHQPKYLRDLETGEYAEPWVRMHAIKDYYDMVAILADYPGIHFTVNLTPVLLTQLEDLIDGYERGTGTDAYLRMTLKDASALTGEDQIYLLTHFFNAHWDNMIHVWPRYRELKDKKLGDTPAELREAAAGFTTQDWRDLQAWFNLAWFDPDFQEREVVMPDGTPVSVADLIEKGRDFTEEDKRAIVEAQYVIMKNVVAVHQSAQERGQLEVITTPFYHPILPLIHDTDLARRAMPGVALPSERFASPGDARLHVERAAEYYESLFGTRPAGLWPAEGAVASEIVGIVADAGFSWMASDDQILQYSLGGSPLTTLERYRMYRVGEEGSQVSMIFRDHRLSDDIGFNFGRMHGVDAANSMMRSLHAIHRRLASSPRGFVVPIILDGENAWEWYPRDGKEFFHSWYSQMESANWIRTVTVAEYLEDHPPAEVLPELWAGSWISHNFDTWIGEPEENTAWEYLAAVRADLDRALSGGGLDEETAGRALDEMLAAEGSDWFWWYGADQSSPNEGAFDAIFRGTLKNVYEIIGEEPPPFLDASVLAPAAEVVAGPAGGAMARGDAAAKLLAGPMPVEGGVLFSVEEASAGTVHLAGEMNGWSTTATPLLDDDGDGIWTVVVKLEPGSYEYKFAIDGGARWVEDKGNPESVSDPYGGRNSVVVVK